MDIEQRVVEALERGFEHPRQPKLIAIDGELDLDELAKFLVSELGLQDGDQ